MLAMHNTESDCIHLLHLVVSVLFFSKSVMGHSVSVQLQHSSPPTTYDCIGGEVGLTNTSILLQYSLVVQTDALHSSSSGASGMIQLQWTDLVVINPLNVSSQISVNFSLDSSVEGLQFRLLQLEHGGGSCNCWALDYMAVTLDNQIQTLLGDGDICFTSGEMGQGNLGLGTYCSGSAGEARGTITRALYFPGSNGSMCGNHSDALISNLGPSLPENCSMVTPRL